MIITLITLALKNTFFAMSITSIILYGTNSFDHNYHRNAIKEKITNIEYNYEKNT